MVPGWGQYTNRQYWKLPIVAGAFAVNIFFIVYNDTRYHYYRSYLGMTYLTDNNPFPIASVNVPIYKDANNTTRDYNQDHGEMKRVVNTILQLFDYLPQTSIVIAATNQESMLDKELIRRFDLNIQFDLPNQKQIDALINLTLKNGKFKFDNLLIAKKISKICFSPLFSKHHLVRIF